LKIRDNLKLQQEETQVREQRQELIRQVCQTNQVPIPEGMVEEYLDSVIEDLKKSNQEINEEEIRQTYRQVGVDEMRWAILWHELADQQKIEVLPSDTEKWIEGFASRNGITTDAARDALTKSGKVKELRNSLLEEKVLEFLLGKAKRVQITKDNKDS
jgi:FKBP-type peptidyl-prolyl cis-trans isomerase (trigger factor)